MAQLSNQFFLLNDEQRRIAYLFLAKQALASWQKQFPSDSNPQYQESIAGTTHFVEIGLPADAIKEIESNAYEASVVNRYVEPITALQDSDLMLSEKAEFAYYGIYNAHRLFRQKALVEEELVLNQLLSALDVDSMEQCLHDAIIAAQ